MQLPISLINSLQDAPGFDEAAFLAVHEDAHKITSIRLNPAKVNDIATVTANADGTTQPVPWTLNGHYLSKRPSFTFDPLFHAGCYYVQEASSMFLEQALRQSVDVSQPLRVLDLCAAPGGKSTHLQSILSADSLLVSNEVVRQRVQTLKDNIIKWGSSNVVVTNNDPKDFKKLTAYFNVIVVDAPCSGSGLFRRDAEAITEWSENNVALCSQRQQRILADILPSLKEDGVLIYSTCSYSKEEDEEISNWLTSEFALKSIKLTVAQDWGIVETQTGNANYGYRFWPNRVQGEGFFLAAFRNQSACGKGAKHRLVTKAVTKQLCDTVKPWARTDGFELINVNEKIFAWPATLFNPFDFLLQQLRIVYSGVFLGELAHKKLIPAHALAASGIVSQNVHRQPLTLHEAIVYLQKNNLNINCTNTGWQLASYKNYPLGWMNVLTNRINNYYPRELRILKQAI